MGKKQVTAFYLSTVSEDLWQNKHLEHLQKSNLPCRIKIKICHLSLFPMTEEPQVRFQRQNVMMVSQVFEYFLALHLFDSNSPYSSQIAMEIK